MAEQGKHYVEENLQAALLLVNAACALHDEMATFAEAGVAP